MTDLTYENLTIPEERLKSIRHMLYHSQQPGYYVVRRFISAQFVSHIVNFWQDLNSSRSIEPFPGKLNLFFGCPNYVFLGEFGNIAYHNYFWNDPPDEVTYAVALQAQILRSRVEARAPYNELFPLKGRSATFRVTNSLRGTELVAPHRDWLGENFDPKRTQMTLFLSKYGRDYYGRGFVFETNQGTKVVFGKDVEIEPGDLAIWRYNNEHAILDVSTDPGMLGFMRIIFPPEAFARSATTRIAGKYVDRLRQWVRTKPELHRQVHRIYARFFRS